MANQRLIMAPELVGVLGIVALIFLIALGVPVAFSFIIAAFFGIIYLESFWIALSTLRTIPYRWAVTYELAPVVLFILMAALVSQGGVAKILYEAANRWVGKIRGSLAMATVFACGAFATVSGSSVATAGAMGAIALPEMKKHHYDERLAAGSAAAGGTLGILIPPSVSFIIYGILVEQSIGKLFIAGILPGIMEIISYVVVIVIIVQLRPSWAPAGVSYTLKEKLSSLRPIWAVLVLAIVVLWGIYGGIFTPTEAGGIGATAAFFILVINKRMTRKVFLTALLEAGTLTCAIFLIIIGAMVFNRFLALSGLTDKIAEIARIFNSPIQFLVFMMVVYLILGCFMDPMAMIILTIPIVLPMLEELDINLIWFGVIAVRMMEVGMITPPVGLNLFTIRAVNPDVPSIKIIQGAIPFLIADLICIVLLIAVPQISLFLPEGMKF